MKKKIVLNKPQNFVHKHGLEFNKGKTFIDRKKEEKRNPKRDDFGYNET